jgi:hypothetical protein
VCSSMYMDWCDLSLPLTAMDWCDYCCLCH